ncbi:TetR/AcrR family transcriptional regulator [Blastococcus sp. TF02A_35]|uniref:TetR/AcrR family transcriptional regulator n=1 Tax=Blastococcus sp. TF02A-35 TaxID=2559612 RepID=UPI00107377BF|nr:TetR/AcrR family transcriptional regulator [Blastococcus sp. TF02A_35]TFV47857.1 TetR/AcrR family transcriptional regulator [Blastococcus sp. TF02A_35]
MATQDQRRTATRAALVEAALGCLVDRGVAGTTTAAITARAGLSSGALFNHFPSKAALLGAVAEQTFDVAVAEYVARFTAVSAVSGDPLGDAVRVFWQIHDEPRLAAVLELFVSARTDRELAAHLAVVNAPHTVRVLAVARQLLPQYADHPALEAVFDLAASAVFGVALGVAGEADRKSRVETLVTVVRAQLGPPSPTP